MVVDRLFEELIKMGYKTTRDQYVELNVEGKMSIDLTPNDARVLSGKFSCLKVDTTSISW